TVLSLTGHRGLLLVLSSPSGAGKTSLSRRLVADHSDLNLSISVTTRGPRPGEKDGREYHFVDRKVFDSMAEGAPEDTVKVYILPPSMADLRRRLYARAQDEAEVIERRLSRSKAEI